MASVINSRIDNDRGNPGVLAIRSRLVLFIVLISAPPALFAGGVYQTAEDFLAEVFRGTPPEPSVIWLTGERKQRVRRILGHNYQSLRVRYWQQAGRSAWILEEIGKEQPITAGFVISQGHIETTRVLAFRESRGWEIRHSFFTDQFRHSSLKNGVELDTHIDGISGATLSVRAMKKLATLALYLDSETRKADVQTSP